jgi:4-hydroxy-tetrahydrodipicolinate reductase
MTQPLRIGIAGIGGRMGGETAVIAEADPRVTLVGGLIRPGSRPPEWEGLLIADDPDHLLPNIDCLIDLSLPTATSSLASASARHGVALVCGVTGLEDDAIGALLSAANSIPVLWSRNLSAGIPLIADLVRTLSAALASYDIEIVETHHRGKRDAPSGTAMILAEAAAEGRRRSIDELAVYGRSGVAPRVRGEIGIHALRAGALPGEHVILLAGDDEEIRISHRALSRRAFATGAIESALRLAGQTPGYRTVI